MGFILAIDGTSGSGKSTTAKRVAERLGWLYLDTGATYRAVATAVIEEGKDPESPEEVTQILDDLNIEVKNENCEQRTLINGRDVTDKLRTDEVNRAVTPVSKMKRVRKFLVNEQRNIVGNRDAVVEGRDIGTVVFPDADLKIYMDAEIEVRAERRRKQKENRTSLEEVKKDLERRDLHDSTRKESPLKKDGDAELIDTTNLTIEEQVERVISKIKKLNESNNCI